MTLISLASCTGAPGVTTLSVATAAALTTTDVVEPVMVEVALSGGVVAGWYDLPTEPGLTSLALALGGEPPDILDHAQELPGGLPAVVAPPSGSRTAKLIGARAAALAAHLADAPVTAVVDCGRIGFDTPLLPVLQASSLVGIVVRPGREEFRLAATTLTELAERAETPLPVGWILAGPNPWSVDEIISRYGLPVLGVVPEDRAGADGIAGRRKLRRHAPLARAARTFAEDVVRHVRIASPEAPLAYLDDERLHPVGAADAPSSPDTPSGPEVSPSPETAPSAEVPPSPVASSIRRDERGRVLPPAAEEPSADAAATPPDDVAVEPAGAEDPPAGPSLPEDAVAAEPAEPADGAVEPAAPGDGAASSPAPPVSPATPTVAASIPAGPAGSGAAMEEVS